MHTEKKRRQLFLIGAASLITSIALFALSALVDFSAGLLALCAILWFVVWRVSVALLKERASTEVRVDDVHNSYDPIIRTLTSALGLRDSITVDQAQRVAELASALGRQLGLRTEQIRLVEKSAILHDIGKMGIAEDVLSRDGSLSERDWAEMKRHPELGFRIFGEIESLSDIAEIVHAHHERFDGQGYPRGLKGEEIPLGSRIFAVADAYAAMTADRPYRKKMSHEMALKEVVRNSLTQFDPQVVRAFLEADENSLLTGRAASEPSENGVPLALPSELWP